MLKLDKNGNLYPYNVIEIDLQEVRAFFVDNFITSFTRKRLFDNYVLLFDEVKSVTETISFSLINGSFVSDKINPNDIDVVFFIEYAFFEKNNEKIEFLKKQFNELNIDCYFEKIYPKNHSYYIRYQTDLLYWHNLFTKSRKREPKGYLKIIIENEK